MAAISAGAASQALGGTMSSHGSCVRMHDAIGKFVSEGNCDHLQHTKSDFADCLTKMGVSVSDVVAGNKAGVGSFGAMKAWDKIVEACYKAERDGKCPRQCELKE